MLISILDYLKVSSINYPMKTAVREEENTLTYSELEKRSQSVGTALIKYDCYKQPVGVYMEKGILAVCSFFGIVSAGGFYCMLNTELPHNRLTQIQNILQPKLIITTTGLKEKAEQIFTECIICAAEELQNTPIDNIALSLVRNRMIDTDPLYINFTSGSTGVPKGIVVSHRSVIDFMEYFTDIFGINSSDIIANQAPFDFDVSVKDIYSCLRTGATLLIVPKRLFSSPTELLDYICDNKVTVMIWAVSALCLISTFHALEYKTPKTVRKILFSGEVMPYKHLCCWMDYLPDTVYVNLYGPTEITCNCTYHILDKNRDYSSGIPIGKPFPNEDVFLLDDNNLRIIVPGTVGKIAVRGTALALGYYRLEENNKQSFVQNPLNNAYPERIYLTGDLGKYDENGDLVFTGRIDNQIKYLGHRIELEEVEKAMSQMDGVDRCFCSFEDGKLRGYYVGTVEKTALRSCMKETLPAFMIPGYIRKLDTMPMTKNGKIDRKKAMLEAKGEKQG